MKNKYLVIHYYSTEDQCFLAFAPELPGCCADGRTLKEALDRLDIIIDEWKETAAILGREIPKPFTGNFNSTMPSICDVSAYILNQTGIISTMTLEKLNYYCLVWSLVWYKQAIFANQFQAWRDGPVCRELFNKHKHQRIAKPENFPLTHNFSESEKMVMDSVIAVYGNEDGEFLSHLTHHERPWIETRGNLPRTAACRQIISNDLILQSYAY